MDTRPIVLTFHNLDLGYGGRRVLQDVDFEVHEGDLWFFRAQR